MSPDHRQKAILALADATPPKEVEHLWEGISCKDGQSVWDAVGAYGIKQLNEETVIEAVTRKIAHRGRKREIAELTKACGVLANCDSPKDALGVIAKLATLVESMKGSDSCAQE